MGQLHEAYTAFSKGESVSSEQQNLKLFSCITLTYAGRHEEAKKKMEELDIQRMSSSELAALMDAETRLGIDGRRELARLSKLATDDEGVMFLAYGKMLSGDKKGAEAALRSLGKRDFKGFGDKKVLFLFLADLCRMGMKMSAVRTALRKASPESLSHDEAMEALRVWNGSGAFESLAGTKKGDFIREWSKAFTDNADVQAMLHGMMWKTSKNGSSLHRLETLADEGNEHALLLVVEHQFENFGGEKAGDLLENLKKLVSLDQGNMLYRKYLYDFLMQIGDMSSASVINRASIDTRIRQETKRFSLIEQFRRLYGMERECPVCHGKNSNDCPLCMGTGYMPFIRTIAFNTSPNRVFCKHPETRNAVADSGEELASIMEWQPMNVPSQIAGSYLSSIGTYASDNQFPDVLVPGETYIFLKLKEDAYKRLAEEGYTLSQIDPLLPVLLSYKKKRFKIKFQAKEQKEIKEHAISFSDFEIEITRETTGN